MKMKKVVLFLVLLLSMATLAVAQGGLSITQNGNSGQSPAWRVQNTNDVYVTVRFVQPSYAITMYMAPNEVRLVGAAQSYKVFVCSTGTPTVIGTFSDEPDYSNTPDQVSCK
jgi:hypothetical protein